MTSSIRRTAMPLGVGILFAAHFHVFLRKAAEIGWTEPADWGHILAVPLVAGYWLHTLWPDLRRIPAQPDWRGLPILLLGLLGYDAGLYPIRNGMLEGVCLVLALAGLLLWQLGMRHLRLLGAPLVFLLFTIRISDRLWELATAKLQDIAASGAAAVLKVCTLVADFDVAIEGNLIRLFQHGVVHPLNVAEACSGIRSLMAFLALGFVLAFLPAGKLGWQRVALFLLAAPVAVVVNIGRVAALGLLTLVDPKLAQGDFHLMVGFLMLVPAAGLLLCCGWMLEKLVVREDIDHGGESNPKEQTATPVTAPWPRATPAIGVLLAALLGQQAWLYATQAVLVKLPLDLRQDLHALPKTLGDWTLEKEEPPEPAEIEHALGTKNYLTRWYTDAAGRHARLHIAYYTGSVDTVPHVPDRCFVAAGATPLDKKGVALAVPAAGGRVPATLFRYRGPDARPAAVVYFFSANGRCLDTPEAVRLQGFSITDRHGYHCKIELEFPGLHEEAQVVAAAGDFMRAAWPSILNCLPAWPPAP